MSNDPGPQQQPSSVARVQAQAVATRREWMRLMQLTAEEIEQSIAEVPPVLEDEILQLDAAKRLWGSQK